MREVQIAIIAKHVGRTIELYGIDSKGYCKICPIANALEEKFEIPLSSSASSIATHPHIAVGISRVSIGCYHGIKLPLSARNFIHDFDLRFNSMEHRTIESFTDMLPLIFSIQVPDEIKLKGEL